MQKGMITTDTTSKVLGACARFAGRRSLPL